MEKGRTCSQCKFWKPWESFAVNKKGLNDRKSVCKECSNKSQRALAKKRREETPELVSLKRWEKHIAKQYGMTLEEVDAMQQAQEGRCAICNRLGNPLHKDGRLYIDHCHSTGKVRGMLCYYCNAMLVLAFDNTKILGSAISYLTKEGT